MAQRIFDMENEQDKEEFFAALPDSIIRIEKWGDRETCLCYGSYWNVTELFKIKWGNKVSIDRPVDKSKYIGCLCWFWDENPDNYVIDFLQTINEKSMCGAYESSCAWYRNCRPVKREEVKFVEDMK